MKRGETASWYKLASHLHMSKQRCQNEITSSEFVDWMVYFDEDLNRFHREDYFLAQIAQEIRRVLSKKPDKIKLDSFLLKFEYAKEKVPMSRKERMEMSKGFWFGMAGFDPKAPG